MIRTLLAIWLLLGFCPALPSKSSVHPFFKHIHTSYPTLPHLDFQLSAGHNASAFLILTHGLNQLIPFIEYQVHLPEKLALTTRRLIEQNPDDFSFTPLLAENPGSLDLFISLGCIMTTRYQSSSLSGSWAETGWILLHEQIQKTLKLKDVSHDKAALLHLAQQLRFFKNAPKWQNAVIKTMRKLQKKASAPPSVLTLAILSHRN